jgi:hypothetical protein
MIPSSGALDLLVLTADKDTAFALEGLLRRPDSLGIRSINKQIFTHPRRDPAVLRQSQDFLRPFLNRASFALVLLDREGCGDEGAARTVLESQVENLLELNGWQGRCAVVVIDPELEAWVWSDSRHVDAVLGWPWQGRDLRTWLLEKQFLQSGQLKPARPKEAVEAALREARRRRSSSIYRDLAGKVGFARCVDPAFLKLVQVLQSWFPR